MRPDVEQASRKLADAIGEAVYVIDGAVIDIETGEIIEGVSGDQFEWLVLRDLQAKRNIEGWGQARATLKKAMTRLLNQAGQRSIATAYGVPIIMDPPPTETVDLAKLAEALDEIEMTPAAQASFYRQAAQAVRPEAVRAFLPETVCDRVISAKPRESYVQVNPPRAAPPVPSRSEQAPTLRQRKAERDE